MTVLLRYPSSFGHGVHGYDDMEAAKAKQAEIGGELFVPLQGQQDTTDPLEPFIAALVALGADVQRDKISLYCSVNYFSRLPVRRWALHIGDWCRVNLSWSEVVGHVKQHVAMRQDDVIKPGC